MHAAFPKRRLQSRCQSVGGVNPGTFRSTIISNLLAEIERTMRLLPDQGKGCDRT